VIEVRNMMTKSICQAILTMVLVLATALSPSVATESADSAVGSQLPPRVRGLLVQEMSAVLDATKSILDAMVRGQDDGVATNAQAIHDSFIMEQSMTAADRQALLDTVPQAFLERDQAFHGISARLAQAARDGDKQGQMMLFKELINACTDCHSRYASDRFPDFGIPAGG